MNGVFSDLSYFLADFKRKYPNTKVTKIYNDLGGVTLAFEEQLVDFTNAIAHHSVMFDRLGRRINDETWAIMDNKVMCYFKNGISQEARYTCIL